MNQDFNEFSNAMVDRAAKSGEAFFGIKPLSLEEQINLACRDLPEDYQITISLERGAATIQGHYPDEPFDYDHDPCDAGLADQVGEVLEHLIEWSRKD